MDTHWTLGFLIGLPVTILLVAACVWAIVAGLKSHSDDALLLAGAGAVALLIVLGVALSPLGFYPYKAQYHQWRGVTGEVTKVDKRLIGNGDKGMEEKFVVRFKGSGQQYGCNDTRCASLTVGDHLSLSCKRIWQYAGTDGYDCNFVSIEEKN